MCDDNIVIIRRARSGFERCQAYMNEGYRRSAKLKRSRLRFNFWIDPRNLSPAVTPDLHQATSHFDFTAVYHYSHTTFRIHYRLVTVYHSH